MHKHYQIKIISHILAYSVRINDICITTNNSHTGARKEILLNQFMLSGKNTIRATLSINPSWERTADDQHFKWEVIEYIGESEPFQESIIHAKEWTFNDHDNFPVIIDDEFCIDIPYGNWEYNSADVLNEDSFFKENLFAYITNFHYIISSKDYTLLKPLLQSKSADLAAAYYIDINQRLSDQEFFFTKALFSRHDANLRPLQLHNLMYNFHAQGKLLEVLTPQGTSPIRFDFDDDTYCEIELFLCHKNGQWILCR